MKRLACWVSICLICASAAILGGCGGGGAAKITISSGGIEAIDQSQMLTLTAVVSNGSSGQTVTWTITSGPGTLSGGTSASVTYTAPASVAGPTSVTITATLTSSNSSSSVSQSFTFMVTPPPSLGAGGNLPAGTEGTAYSQSPTITGGAGTLAWAVQATPNPLPAGLSINSSTGAITGTPTGPAGSSTFTVKVTDSGNPQITASAQFTILINNYPAPTIAPASGALPAGVAGTAYAQQTFTVSGGHGPYTFSVVNGSLPPGLTPSSSSSMLVISGTPSGPACNPCTFSVKVVDSSNPTQTVTNNYSIVITLPAAPTITTTQAQVTAAPATAGTAYSFQFHGTGTGTLTWSATGLPADALSLNTSNGTVSGTPTAHASLSVTLTLSDSFGQSSGAIPFTITVNNPAAPVITTTQAQVTAAAATLGTAYSFTFQATGTGTLTWSATSGLPADGLSLSTSTGAVSGTPTIHQTVPITLTVSDTFGQTSAPAAFTITVNNPAPPVITTTPAQVPSATVNTAYSFTLQGTGYGTLVWSTTPALSDGLSLNTSTGAITGTPTTATTLSFSVTLTDGLGQQTTVTGFSIVVSTESIAFTPSVPSSVTAGGTLSVNATVSNDPGSGGVDWTVTCTGTCGSFTAAHTVSGTATTFDAPSVPPTGGTVTITATAHDAPNPQVSAVVTITPIPLAIAPTSATLPSGTVSIAYTTTFTASGGVPPYTFSLDGSSAALPSPLQFNAGPPATITGTPTATSTTTGIIVDVTDSEVPPVTVKMTYSLTINSATAACGSGSESLLNGQYAFLLQGFTGTGTGTPTIIAASFAANGTGGITGGDEDINTFNNANHYTIDNTSTYSVGSDHRGCLTIVNSNSTTSVFRFNLGGISSGKASKGWVIEFDETTGSGTHVTGPMRLQDTTSFSLSKLKTRYAIGIDGWDQNGSLGHFALVGSLTVNTSGTISNGFADANDSGMLFSSITGITGSIGTISATTGRAIGSYTIPSSLTFDYAFYMIDANEMFIISTDNNSNVPVASGRAIVTASSFTSTSVSGNYIVHATGNDNENAGPTGVSDVLLAQVSLNGGTLGGTSYEYENDGSGLQSDSITGSYSIASSSGRITITGSGNHQPVLYIATPTDGISAFFMDTGGSVNFGVAEAQPNQTYSIANLAASNGGVFFLGNEDPGDNTAQNQIDEFTLAANGSFTDTEDEDNPQGTPPLQPNQTDTGGAGSFTMGSNGIGTGGSGSILMTNGSRVFGIFNSTDTAELQIADQ
jgi:large repetitive protein